MASRALLLPIAMLLAACGARPSLYVSESDETPADPAGPSTLYLPDDEGCAKEGPVASAEDALTPDGSGQGIAVVEIGFADECTGLGGQYVIAREVDGFRELWLGGHGCQFFSPELTGGDLGFGVARYNQTAALFQVPAEVCIGFPGEPPGLSSDAKTLAIALFPTLAAAEAFAAELQ